MKRLHDEILARAKQCAAESTSGWGTTLLAYVEELEKQIAALSPVQPALTVEQIYTVADKWIDANWQLQPSKENLMELCQEIAAALPPAQSARTPSQEEITKLLFDWGISYTTSKDISAALMALWGEV